MYAYILCACYGAMGTFFGVSSSVVGLTFSAVGTSFPNYWSSIVAARTGHGEMAGSNALGSNTYDYFVCLGLPWLVYNIVFGEYNTFMGGGIVLLTMVLINVLYYFTIALMGFTIPRWLGYIMYIVYVVIIVACCSFFP